MKHFNLVGEPEPPNIDPRLLSLDYVEDLGSTLAGSEGQDQVANHASETDQTGGNMDSGMEMEYSCSVTSSNLEDNTAPIGCGGADNGSRSGLMA